MGTQLPSPKGRHSPQFLARVCCGQTAGWTKMPLGIEVGLVSGDFVLDGDLAPIPKRGQSPPNFRPTSIVAKRLYQDTTWYGGRPHPTPHCVRWVPSSPSPKGHIPQFSANVRCGQTAGWTKMPLGMEVGLDPVDFVIDGT